MSWKELYKPTIGKLIIPIAILIFQIYQVIIHWGSYFMCKVDCASNIYYALSSILMSSILIILLVYPIVCWIYALGKWIITKVKK